MCSECCYLVYLSQLPLILSADVEENPGPHPTDTAQLANILAALQRIETGQADLLAKVTSLQNGQRIIKANIREMLYCIAALETNVAPLKNTSQNVSGNGST